MQQCHIVLDTHAIHIMIDIKARVFYKLIHNFLQEERKSFLTHFYIANDF